MKPEARAVAAIKATEEMAEKMGVAETAGVKRVAMMAAASTATEALGDDLVVVPMVVVSMEAGLWAGWMEEAATVQGVMVVAMVMAVTAR